MNRGPDGPDARYALSVATGTVQGDAHVAVGTLRDAAPSPVWRAALTAARWYAHHELPRWTRLVEGVRVTKQELWKRAPSVEARDKITGDRVRLDLSDFFQRIAFFLGCYQEVDVISLLTGLLRPGEVFLDGGANIGLLTLVASRLVDDKGEVIAVEPNARVLEILRWHVGVNGRTNVRIVPAGLSDREENLHFCVPCPDNRAAGTLGPVPARYGGHARDEHIVTTVLGDHLLTRGDDRPLVIKLDVEGFELRALHGLRETIRTRQPVVIAEVNPELLTLNGARPEQLDEELAPLGYVPYLVWRSGWKDGHRLGLQTVRRDELAPDAELGKTDIAWIHPSSVHHDRVKDRILPWHPRPRRKPGAAT